MMKNIISAIFLTSILSLGITFGIASAQVANEGNNTNDTTAAVANLTNASSSLEEAQNMSVIEGTMNATKWKNLTHLPFITFDLVLSGSTRV